MSNPDGIPPSVDNVMDVKVSPAENPDMKENSVIAENTDISAKSPEEIKALMASKEIGVKDLTPEDIERSLQNTPLSMHASKVHEYTTRLMSDFEAGNISSEQFADGLHVLNDQLKQISGKTQETLLHDQKRKGRGQPVRLDPRADTQAEQMILVMATLLAMLKGIIFKIRSRLSNGGAEINEATALKMSEASDDLASTVSDLEQYSGQMQNNYNNSLASRDNSGPNMEYKPN